MQDRIRKNLLHQDRVITEQRSESLLEAARRRKPISSIGPPVMENALMSERAQLGGCRCAVPYACCNQIVESSSSDSDDSGDEEVMEEKEVVVGGAAKKKTARATPKRRAQKATPAKRVRKPAVKKARKPAVKKARKPAVKRVCAEQGRCMRNAGVDANGKWIRKAYKCCRRWMPAAMAPASDREAVVESAIDGAIGEALKEIAASPQASAELVKDADAIGVKPEDAIASIIEEKMLDNVAEAEEKPVELTPVVAPMTPVAEPTEEPAAAGAGVKKTGRSRKAIVARVVDAIGVGRPYMSFKAEAMRQGLSAAKATDKLALRPYWELYRRM